MNKLISAAAAAACLTLCGAASAQVIINEVWQNPPGSGTTDDRYEYIELYGRPGMDLTGYAIALVQGGYDEDGNDVPDETDGDEAPELDECFTLDGWTIGPDGFFVLVNTVSSTRFTNLDALLMPNPGWDGQPLNESPTNKRWLNGASFQATHIEESPDNSGKLSNDGSASYVLVRARPNHSIVAGQSVYAPGYAWYKDANPDVNYDGKMDFGTETALPGFPAALALEPYQMVDDVAWSHLGGKEYVVDSQQEIAETPGFNPDGISRIDYFIENPMQGSRTRDNGASFDILQTRTADESWIYGESFSIVTFDYEDDVDTEGCYLIKAPTDQTLPGFDGLCDPEPDTACLPDPNDPTPRPCAPNGGQFLFDDIYVGGFVMTPGAFNDHPANANIKQISFNFPSLSPRTGKVIELADFTFDGVVDQADLDLITDRLGATLDDTEMALYDNATPGDTNDDYMYPRYIWQGALFQQMLMMMCMDQTDGPGGTNAEEITQADIDAVAALVVTECDGDANGDNTIDVNDISYVLFRLGGACPPCEGDANGDNTIDVNDISYVLFRLGNPC